MLAGGALAYELVRPHAAWAARAARPAAMLAPWSLPERLPGGPTEAARTLIGASLLAPSFWNSQPWRYEVDGGEIRLVLDPQRVLPVCDPDQRFALLSLGAALENLLVAARAWGTEPLVHYLPWGAPDPSRRSNAPFVVARVTWRAAERHFDRVLFGALTERRTNTRRFDGRGITQQNRTQLAAQVQGDVRLHWLDGRPAVRRVGELLEEATAERWRDRRAQAERTGWIRFDDGDSRRRGDGVAVERLGVGGPARWFASHYFGARSRFLKFGAATLAKETRDDIRSSGALALITTPRRTETSVLSAGQAYERLALMATALGIAQQPLTAAIESERHRGALAHVFGAAGEEPLLLVRLGHAEAMHPTPRRGVGMVSTYRTS